jgi:hypothetical protein
MSFNMVLVLVRHRQAMLEQCLWHSTAPAGSPRSVMNEPSKSPDVALANIMRSLLANLVEAHSSGLRL